MEPIDKAITKFRNHPSVHLLKNVINVTNIFSFEEIELNEVYNKIRSWNPKKAGTDNDIPAKKVTVRTHVLHFLKDLSNNIVMTGNYAKKLKLADITPIFKKKDPLKKEVSVLAIVSKIYERL